MNLLRLVLVAVFGLVVIGVPASARADEIAPELETAELRAKVDTEAKKLVAGLAASDRRRLVGLYVAFDTNASDPGAMVACDDDGDYVIVLTEAMLRLASLVARAQSYDEASGGRALEDYAVFVARSQIPGHRLVPPPSGFFTAPIADSTYDSRLREALAFILARELAHLRAGDLVCGRPTATHEHGDDEWTAAEQQQAVVTAARIYPGAAAARDAEATTRLLDMGRSEAGSLGLLRFFAQLEVERAERGTRFSPSYLARHPSAAARGATVRATVSEYRTK